MLVFVHSEVKIELSDDLKVRIVVKGTKGPPATYPWWANLPYN